jgi:hypothetical protein
MQLLKLLLAKMCYFWLDKWIKGKTVEQVAPDVFTLINPNIKAKRTVAEASPNSCWLEDIKKPMSIRAFRQALTLWEELINIQLSSATDVWTWSWESKRI